MMNVANPEEAFRLSFIPNDGVGLAREEFIISSYIKVHPLALVDYAKIDNSEAKANIDKLTAGYDDKPQFFVDKLAQGVAMIAAAFYPKDVIVRLSDTSRWKKIQCSVSAGHRVTTAKDTRPASHSNAVL
jgi:pyruvate,water dikinase